MQFNRHIEIHQGYSIEVWKPRNKKTYQCDVFAPDGRQIERSRFHDCPELAIAQAKEKIASLGKEVGPAVPP